MRALLRIAYWCLWAAVAVMGGRLALGTVPNQPWPEAAVPWLVQYWVPTALIVAAAVMATMSATKWFLDRHCARELRRQIRQNLTPGAFAETDIVEALRHLLQDSVWGWRQYARLNSWTMVDGFHLDEFKRAALAGEILTVGYSSREGKVVCIERRDWGAIEINPQTLEARPQRLAVYLHKPTFSDLAVATADLEQVWPRASVWRRRLTSLWVWSKKRWYSSRLSNWLDPRHSGKKG